MTTADKIAKYKLVELVKLQSDFPKLPDPQDYSFVANTLSTFNVNMKRVHGILFNGPYNLQFGLLGGISSCSAAGDSTNYRTINWWDTENPDSLMTPQLRLAHKSFSTHYDKIRNFALTPQGQRAFGSLANILFENLLSVEDQPAAHGFEASMAAALIGAWTAFEVLAGDLWEHVVNHRLVLAFVALDAEPNRKDGVEVRGRKSKTTIELLLQKVKDPDFDIRSQMGTLLRQNRDFSFLRRTDARDNFIKIFPKSKKQIKDIFDSQIVRWLAATRNVLVHKGGIVDSEFRILIGDHPELKKMKKGVITVDCGIVRDFVTAIMAKSVELLTFVNVWMKNNQVKNARQAKAPIS